MKLVMSRRGFRHLVPEAAGHTLCGRDCSSWDEAPEERMRDVSPHEYCVVCWQSAMKASERFGRETWADGSPVYPLDFGKSGYISPDEVRRVREAHAELQASERGRMRQVQAS
jgi:hypothetical protein